MKFGCDYTPKEAAETIGVSIATIFRRIRAGEIRVYRFGPQVVRIPHEEIERIRRGEAA